MSVLDSPYFRRPRGRKKPRTFQVTVQYEQDLADFEDAARRLGQLDMGAFLVFAGRVAVWLLTDADSDEAGHPFRRESGHPFRGEGGHPAGARGEQGSWWIEVAALRPDNGP